jgi:LAO/AO transport system kinase
MVDCLVLVLNPDSGDVIQMLKAGLMEWADLYVVNKSDRPGAREFAAALRGVIAGQGSRHGLPPAHRVHSVQANSPDSPEMRRLADAVRTWPGSSQARAEMWTHTVEDLVLASLLDHVRREARDLDAWSSLVEATASGKREPAEVVTGVLSLLSGEPTVEGAPS